MPDQQTTDVKPIEPEADDPRRLQQCFPAEYAGGQRDALIETPPVPHAEALDRCAVRIDRGMLDSAAYWLGYARQVQASEHARTGADDEIQASRP